MKRKNVGMDLHYGLLNPELRLKLVSVYYCVPDPA